MPLSNDRSFPRGHLIVLGLWVMMGVVALGEAHGGESETVKHINWGLETWELGKQDFMIEFKEARPIRLLRIVGHVTAGPLPAEGDATEHGKLVRQSLVTLITPGKDRKVSDVEIQQTPGSRANHSLAPHVFNVNIKQQGDDIVVIPLDYDFRDQRIVLPENRLLMHFDNRSYRFDTQSQPQSFESRNAFDALNTEIHLNVIYAVQAP